MCEIPPTFPNIYGFDSYRYVYVCMYIYIYDVLRDNTVQHT